MLSHLRHSLRTLARTRGFALVAVLTLAVGIGATTAIFSALQALVIGRKLRLNGYDAVVVGVMPAGFEFVSPWMHTAECRLWTPRSFDDEEKKQRDSHYLLGVARLRDGVSVATADAEIKTIGKRLTRLYPDSNTRKEFLVRSLHEEMTHDIASQIWLLFGAVALVLLVACGNVASMLLARSARREGEFAVRVALGASSADLMKLALVESLMLAVAGAVVGIVLAYGGIEVLRLAAPVTEARKAAIALNAPALGFGLLATALTALLAGLPPALAARRTSVATVMRSDARGSVGSRAQHRMLRGLVIGQVAVAFVLANGAVLFSTAYLRILRENELLATDRVVTAQVTLNGARYEKDDARVRFWYDFTGRAQALPGVMNAAITSKLPLEGGSNTSALVNGESYDPTQRRMSVERSSVTEDYFTAMGLHLVKGRALRAEDRTGSIRGVVVNQACVDKAWPHKEPLGEIMRANQAVDPWFVVRVVGVVENVKQWGADAEVQPEMYTTPEGHWGRSVFLVLRTPLPTAQLVPALRRELAAIDPELALKDVRTMREVVGSSTQGQRAVAGLVNFFMATALGLVAVGLYGTLSYHVQQRTREIGVRVALGALKGNIVRLVFSQGGRWVGVGLVIGLAGSVALSFALKSLVYKMEGLTAAPLLLAAVAVGFAAVLACWLPARRAAKLDPLEALRSD